MTLNLKELAYQAEWIGRQYARSLVGLSSEWNQADWISGTLCGTKACLAGNVALHTGWKPSINEYGHVEDRWTKDDTDSTYIALSIARHELGLTLDIEASLNVMPFNGSYNFDDIMNDLQKLIASAANDPANAKVAKKLGLIY